MHIQRRHMLAMLGAAPILAAAAPGSSKATIFRARRIITMDAGTPTASSVAVADGTILGVADSLAALEPLIGKREFSVDPRFENDGATRALFTLPDGTAVDLIGLDKVRYKRNGFAVTVSMAGHPLVAGAWNHLAWVITADGNAIDLYRDGYK